MFSCNMTISNNNKFYQHDLGAIPYAIIRGEFISWQEVYREPKTMRYSASKSADQESVPVVRLIYSLLEDINYIQLEKIYE